jgi:hypothetical protein
MYGEMKFGGGGGGGGLQAQQLNQQLPFLVTILFLKILELFFNFLI